MKQRYAGLIAVMALSGAVMVAEVVSAQAPGGGAPRGGGAGAPGGGQRGAGAPGGGAGAAAGGGGQRGTGGGRGGGPVQVAATRTPDGKPDMTGYYMGPLGTNFLSNWGTYMTDPQGRPPYNAEWEAKVSTTGRNARMYEEPYAHCLPTGVPTNFGIQMGFQVVQDKTAIFFSWDTVGAYRLIYLDNRKHLPANIKLYQGDSIGKWEGDTLVVETKNQAAGWFDASGYIHSDQIHVIERFTMDGVNINYEATITDPVAFTQPLKMGRPLPAVGQTKEGTFMTFTRNNNVPQGFRGRPTGYEQTETACVEGERDTALYVESAGGLAKESTNAFDALPEEMQRGIAVAVVVAPVAVVVAPVAALLVPVAALLVPVAALLVPALVADRPVAVVVAPVVLAVARLVAALLPAPLALAETSNLKMFSSPAKGMRGY